MQSVPVILVLLSPSALLLSDELKRVVGLDLGVLLALGVRYPPPLHLLVSLLLSALILGPMRYPPPESFLVKGTYHEISIDFYVLIV